MLYQNTSESARRWDHLQRDGHTLELLPGEAVDLDLPEGFEDAWLKPVKGDAPPANPELADAQAEMAKAQADVAAAEAAEKE